MTLCTQLDVEQKLQWDITAEPDTTVAALIADAQAAIEAEIGRTIESASRTESFDGGKVALFLKWWPATTITSVTEDGTVLVEDTDFVLKQEDRLIRITTGNRQRLWRPFQVNAIDVVYTGGYLSGHSDEHDMALEHLGSICAEIVARAFRKGAASAAIPAGSAGAVQSVSLEGSDSVTYSTGSGESFAGGGLTRFVYLEEEEKAQLDPYKRLWLGFA